MTFVKMLPQIQAMAANMCMQWGNKFVVNELVNEAWIKSEKNDDIDAPLIMITAKRDILDYIRSYIGRNKHKEKYDKRCKYKRLRKYPKFITKFTTNHHTPVTISKNKYIDRNNLVCDKEYVDKNYNVIENKEFVKLLLSQMTRPRMTAMIHYYFKENTFAEIGAILGKSSGTIFEQVREGKQECVNMIKDMGLEPWDVI